jgi:hypothetical protein
MSTKNKTIKIKSSKPRIPRPRTLKSPSHKNNSSKKSPNKKSNIISLTQSIKNNLSNALLTQASEFKIYDRNKHEQFLLSLSSEQRNSLNSYQNSSIKINSFHRTGYDVLSEIKLNNTDDYYDNEEDDDDNNDKKEFIDLVDSFLKEINSIDSVFTNTNCPKTTDKTILFRGTEKYYGNQNKKTIEKSYISTSKSLEALFDMKTRGDEVLSNDCCINVLVVDPNIPYLDLENNIERWSYQQEVLLPRGLKSKTIGNTTFEHNNSKYNVYLMHITLNKRNEYKLPDIQKYDGAHPKNLDFFFNEQTNELIKLSNMFQEEQDWSDEKEDIDDLLQYIYDQSNKGIKYVCTKERYKKLCNYILETLKKIIPKMMISMSVKDNCKLNLPKTLDSINKILISTKKIITPTKYIKIAQC